MYCRSIFRGDNIIKLAPLDLNPALGCSSKATVSSLSNENVRKIAIIFAEDANSGETIRCDVIVDTIASLQIVTKTRELFVGDAPELFEVSAFDDQGTRKIIHQLDVIFYLLFLLFFHIDKFHSIFYVIVIK